MDTTATARHPQDSPPASRRDQTRLRIIKGGACAFAARGFENTSVQSILDAAGVSRRTFYLHFSDKSAVLSAIYERSLKHLLACRREAMKHPGSGIQRLVRAQAVYMDFVSTAGPIIRVITSEALRPDGALHGMRLAMHQQIEDMYCAAFEEAEGRRLDPMVARSIILLSESLTLHVLMQHPGDAAKLAHASAILKTQVEQLLAAD